ncbi:MAG: cadherin-like domain-containing protein, partial [Cyanobacteria bacterium P01_F01_bin.150]
MLTNIQDSNNTVSLRTVLFIDASVQDHHLLTQGLPLGIDVHVLDANKDGIEQITYILGSVRVECPYFDIYIASHGAPGTLYLGNAELSLSTLDRYAKALEAWFFNSFTADTVQFPYSGSLKLYACNVAAGDAGEEFITKLHRLTGANIAASTTPVGNIAKGGNWILDAVRTDSADSGTLVHLQHSCFAPEAQAAYTGVLADPTITDNAALAREAEEETAFSLADLVIADADGDNLTVTVTVASDGDGPIGELDRGGSTSATQTFSGTAAVVTAELNSLQFTGRDNFSGDATIQIVVTGGGAPVAQDITIAVADVNDTPEITPVALEVTEGGTASFGDANFNVTDVDNEDIQVIIKVTQLPSEGTLKLGGNRLVIGSTFDYTQIGNLNYEHDGSQVTDPAGRSIIDFEVTVDDGAGGQVTEVSIPITVTPINQAPTVSGSAELFEGEENHVVSLDITDVDQDPGNPFSVKILSLPTDGDANADDGVLRLKQGDGSFQDIVAGDIISAADFAAGNVVYTHDGNDDNFGNPDPLTFEVEVTDDGGGEGVGAAATVSSVVELTIKPNNDDPILETNEPLIYDAISDGVTQIIQSGNLVNGHLLVTDVDSPVPQLTYTITALPDSSKGVLRLNGADMAVGGSFTQQDLENNVVTYTFLDDANTGTVTDFFEFTVRDGEIREYPSIREGGIYADENATDLEVQRFNIEVTGPGSGDSAGTGTPNSVPTKKIVDQILEAELDEEGSNTFTLTPSELEYEDVDNIPSELVYRITQPPTSGTLQLNGVNVELFGSFTQQDIIDGNVTFVHGGNEDFEDLFKFTVTDGTAIAQEETFVIQSRPVNDAPTLSVNGSPIVTEGQSETITTSHFSMADVDGTGDRIDDLATPNTLTFRIVDLPDYGTLELNDVTVDGSEDIPQSALTDGSLVYVHDGSENFADTFDVQVNDNQNDEEITFGFPDDTSNNLSGIKTVAVEIASLNDNPFEFSKENLVVDEGGTGAINGFATVDDLAPASGPHLTYKDPDNSDVQRQYAITTAVQFGTLFKDGQALSVGSVFSQADLDAGLITYEHDGTENYVDDFAFDVRDGGGDSVPGTYQITVDPVNDAPELTVPTEILTFDTDAPFDFGNTITVDDIDLASIETGETDVLKVTLNLQKSGSTYAGSTLTLGSISGLTITDGTSGISGGIITIEGTKADVQAALNGLTLQVPQDEDTTLNLVVTLDDLNNGGPDPDDAVAGYNVITKNIQLNTSNDNDAPTITAAPMTVTLNEDGSFTFSGGNAIAIADVDSFDSTNNTVELKLQDGNGTLTLPDAPGVTVTGSGSDTITLKGSIADINAALDALVYTPPAEFNDASDAATNTGAGTASDILEITVNDGGNTGRDGANALEAKEVTQSINLIVTPVNDKPSVTAPSDTQVLATADPLEFSSTEGNAISIDDLVDLDENAIDDFTVTLSITDVDGQLTADNTSGATITDNGTDSVTIEGTKAQINAALDGLTYDRPNLNIDASYELTVAVDDEANGGTAISGSGGALTDSKVININVSSQNEVPGITTNGSEDVDEDTVLTFSNAEGNAISINDPDDFGGILNATLSVDDGTLNLADTTGVTVTGNGGGTVEIEGTEAAINAVLANGLDYQGTLHFNGADTLTIEVDDNGNTGIDTGAPPAQETIAITVNPVNDAPVFTDLGGTVNYTEGDPAITLDSDALLADIELDDGNDWDGASLTIERNGGANGDDVFMLPAIHSSIGTVTQNTGGTLIFTFNSSATSASVDTFLRGIQYSNSNTVLTETSVDLNYTINDGNGPDPSGAQGSGGPLTDIATVTVNIDRLPEAVNDVATVDEDSTDNVINILGNDTDLGDGLASVALKDVPTNGTVTLNDNNTAANPNDDFFEYTPDENFEGSDSFTYTITDTDGDESTATVNITVTPVNDKPSVSAPNDIQVLATADPLEFSALEGNAITIDDLVDLNENAIDDFTVTLSITDGSGQLTADNTSGATITDNGTDSVTIEGTKAQINAALDGLTYDRTNRNVDASYELTVAVDDEANGGTAIGGSGGALTDSKVININVSSQNEVPGITTNGSEDVDEDTVLTFSTAEGNAISIDDPDDFGGILNATLSVDDGTLTLADTTGVTVTGNGGGTVEIEGTEAAINAVLANGLDYQGTLHFNGADTLTIDVDDNGNTGIDTGAPPAQETIAITVNPVNDAPVFTDLGGTVNYTEGDPAITLDSNALLADIELDDGNNWNGATLTVARQGGASTDDLFSHSGTLEELTEGGALEVDGTTVGTVTTNSGGTLLLTFNGSATGALVDRVLQQLAYSNGSAEADPTVTLDYTINDANGPDPSGVQGSGGPLTDTATVTVNINRLPESVDDAPINVDEDSTDNVINVLTNDTDLGDGLDSVAIETNPSNGTVTLNDQGTTDPTDDVFEYTPNANFEGTDSFTYTITDTNGDESTATVNIVVDPINDAPEFTDLGGPTAYEEGAAPVVLDGDAALSDVELDAFDDWDGATLTIERQGGANTDDEFTLPSTSIGAATTNANGTLVFEFNDTATATDVDTFLRQIQYSNSNSEADPTVILEYTINDGNTTGAQGSGGPLEGTGSVTVNINRLPVAVTDGPINVDEDSTANVINVLANDTDFGDGLDSVAIATTPSNGTVTLNNQGTLDPTDDVFEYTPDADFEGTDSFTYTITDADGDESTATVNIVVDPINDAPEFTGLDGTVNYTENAAPVVIDGDATVDDIDLSDFNASNGDWGGASLTIERQGGSSEDDVFSNSGTLDPLTETSDLVVDGTTIGTVLENSDGTLRLEFNGSATNALVDSALQQIAYSNANDDPGSSVTLEYTISDGNDGNQGPNPAPDGTNTPLTGTATKTVAIAQTNDKPVVTPGGPLDYTENNPATVIDNTITLVDSDDDDITGGTVTIHPSDLTPGDILAVDTAAFPNISASYDPGTGVLTLTGTDTKENYEAVMRLVTFESSSDDPTETSNTREITWSVTDANSDGAGAQVNLPVTSTINVTPVNDPPTLDLDGDDSSGATGNNYQDVLIPGGGPVAIGDVSDVAIGDLDDDDISEATITLTTRPNGATEELILDQATVDAINSDITVIAYDSATGELKLAGDAPLADYEAVIAAITYDNNNPTNRSDRTIEVVVTDAGGHTVTKLESNIAIATIRFDSDGDGVVDSIDLDDDNDGILDTDELGLTRADMATDVDSDGIPDLMDPDQTPGDDLNNDGILDSFDTDGDGIINSLDLDSDNDGISDLVESGQLAGSVTDSVDIDNDGQIDSTTDDDNDGLLEPADDNDNDANSDGTVDPTSTDTDGIDDYLDLDADNDGIPDAVEAQPTDGYISPAGPVDLNGVNTAIGLVLPENTDGEDNPDYIDTDSDNDAIDDINESGLVLDNTDNDNDGIDDAVNASYSNPDGDIDSPPEDLNSGGTITPGHDDEVDYRNVVPVVDLDSVGDADPSSDYTTAFTTLGTPVSITNAGTTTDADTPDIDSLTITLPDVADGDDEVLVIDGQSITLGSDQSVATTPSGFTITYTEATKTVVITESGDDGQVPDADFTSLLAGITYENQSLSRTEGDRTIQVVANDGTSDSPLVTTTLFVDPDADGDGIGNSVDIDDDNDGITDVEEMNGDPALDTDGDGVIDSLDLDSDGDGILDVIEAGHGQEGQDADGDGRLDGNPSAFGPNGLFNALDDPTDPTLANYTPLDTDGDGNDDFQDLDADNDGLNDVIEALGTDTDGDGIEDNTTGPDADGDGVPDALDADVDSNNPLDPPDT